MKMIVDGRGSYFPGDNSLQTLARQLDHDVRSPLTVICNYGECLAGVPNLEAGPQQMFAEHIVAQARRLGRLTGNFLVVAAPPLSDDLHVVHLGDALDETLTELADLIRLHEVSVQWEKPAAAMVSWPPEVLPQLLVAVVEVALESAPHKSALQLSLTPASEEGWLLELTSETTKPSRVREGFTWRAVETVIRQRGGEVELQLEPRLRLCVRLPRMGRVCNVMEEQLLERSA
jgi:light-regulated signal transduction histidine kinase (bacteriophytochrome)